MENGSFFVIRATDTKMKRLLGSDLPKTRHLTSGSQDTLQEAIQKRNTCIPNQQTGIATSAKR
jgi:hypothetical protein